MKNDNTEEVSLEDLGIFGGCDCSSCAHGCCGPEMMDDLGEEEEI